MFYNNGFASHWTVFLVCVITVLNSAAHQILLLAKVRQQYSDDHAWDNCCLVPMKLQEKVAKLLGTSWTVRWRRLASTPLATFHRHPHLYAHALCCTLHSQEHPHTPGRRGLGCLVVRRTTGRTSLWDPKRYRPSSTFHARSTFQVHSSDGTGGVMYQSARLHGRMWENPSQRIYTVRRCGVAALLCDPGECSACRFNPSGLEGALGQKFVASFDVSRRLRGVDTRGWMLLFRALVQLTFRVFFAGARAIFQSNSVETSPLEFPSELAYDILRRVSPRLHHVHAFHTL